MARIDLNETNGWIPEEYSSKVVTIVNQGSAVEALARREPMATNTKLVPRFLGDDPEVVAEGGTYPEADATLDDVVLVARKFGLIYRISEEDLNDSIVDVLNTFKTDWATKFARKFDNACLGVTTAGDGTDAHPFDSVYRQVTQNASENHVATAGELTFEQLSEALGTLEEGDYYDEANTIVIAHPAFKNQLRSLHDSNGRPIVDSPLDGTPPSMFGYRLVYSAGAKTSAAATSTPTGNPLLIVGSRNHLIDGVRSGPESLVSTDARFTTDEPLLKVRARRGFNVARPEAFSVVELTAGA